MDASNERLFLLLSDGSKHQVNCHDNFTVKQLRDTVCQIAECEEASLRVIYAGKEMKNKALTLKSLGFGRWGNITVHCAIKPSITRKKEKAHDLTEVVPNVSKAEKHPGGSNKIRNTPGATSAMVDNTIAVDLTGEEEDTITSINFDTQAVAPRKRKRGTAGNSGVGNDTFTIID